MPQGAFYQWRYFPRNPVKLWPVDNPASRWRLGTEMIVALYLMPHPFGGFQVLSKEIPRLSRIFLEQYNDIYSNNNDEQLE